MIQQASHDNLSCQDVYTISSDEPWYQNLLSLVFLTFWSLVCDVLWLVGLIFPPETHQCFRSCLEHSGFYFCAHKPHLFSRV